MRGEFRLDRRAWRLAYRIVPAGRPMSVSRLDYAAGATAGIRPKRRPSRAKRRQALEAYLFLLPWVAGLVILTAGPLGASLYLSFTNYDLLGTPSWIGIQNYVDLFLYDPRFRTALQVTFIYVFLGVPLNLGFALLVAVLLNQKVRGARALPQHLLPAVAPRRQRRGCGDVAADLRRRGRRQPGARPGSASTPRTGSRPRSTRSTRWCCCTSGSSARRW